MQVLIIVFYFFFQSGMDVKEILLWYDIKVFVIVFVSGFVLLVCLIQFNVISVIINIVFICFVFMLVLRLLLIVRLGFLKSEFEYLFKYVIYYLCYFFY